MYKVHRIRISEKQERTYKWKIFEVIMIKNFLKLVIDTKPQFQEVQRTTSKVNIKILHMGILYSNAEKQR